LVPTPTPTPKYRILKIELVNLNIINILL